MNKDHEIAGCDHLDREQGEIRACASHSNKILHKNRFYLKSIQCWISSKLLMRMDQRQIEECPSPQVYLDQNVALIIKPLTTGNVMFEVSTNFIHPLICGSCGLPSLPGSSLIYHNPPQIGHI